MMGSPRIAVIGAGIVGASIAYHLARRGAEVTVLDRGQPAGEATEKSFAWINASYGNPEHYYRLLNADPNYARHRQRNAYGGRDGGPQDGEGQPPAPRQPEAAESVAEMTEQPSIPEEPAPAPVDAETPAPQPQ